MHQTWQSWSAWTKRDSTLKKWLFPVHNVECLPDNCNVILGCPTHILVVLDERTTKISNATCLHHDKILKNKWVCSILVFSIGAQFTPMQNYRTLIEWQRHASFHAFTTSSTRIRQLRKLCSHVLPWLRDISYVWGVVGCVWGVFRAVFFSVQRCCNLYIDFFFLFVLHDQIKRVQLCCLNMTFDCSTLHHIFFRNFFVVLRSLLWDVLQEQL